MIYDDWLESVKRLALRSEWCIEADPDYWKPKWKMGMSPQAAVNQLFKEVRDGTDACEASEPTKEVK